MTAPFALTGPAQLANPYPVYHRYRVMEPIHRVAPTGPDRPATWYLFRYDDVAGVLTDQRFGRSARIADAGGQAPAAVIPDGYPALRQVVENWLVFLDPPRHTRLRALIARHVTATVVARLRPRIAEITDGLLDGVRARPHTDLVADFAAPLPILVISELLGIPADRQGWIRDRAVALQQANTSRRGDPAERYGPAETAACQLAGYFQEEVARRRRDRRDDLMGALVRAGGPPPGVSGVDVPVSDAPLSDVEIVATCIHLLTAGHETTTNLISKATLALLRHPRVRAQLGDDPAMMASAVDEFIRYDGPVQMVTRWAYRDVVVGRHLVVRGSRVVLVLGSANRDPEKFADPDRLDIWRDVRRHGGFGLGIHYCLGAGLARVEVEVGLTALLRRLPGLAHGDEPVRYADDLVFHGPARLPLRTGA
ncbi:MAG: cytochrome StaP [Micromonosporaceae bacterium]|nr:cytochrome StaP [Micromonosporaceae bacterium]